MNCQPDYRSPEFYKIISEINEVLKTYNKEVLSKDLLNTKYIKVSQFDTGKYNNKIEWRITNKNAPQLFDEKGIIINSIKDKLIKDFKQYVDDKTIRFGNPLYTKDAKGNPMASIVILLTQLPDNVITKVDLSLFEAGDPAAVKKCLEIESRMFKRDTDVRSPEKRISDFAFALKYEPVLLKTYLLHIHGLSLEHQDNVITLEADPKSDFLGYVDTGLIESNYCPIEGKATVLPFEYVDSEKGHNEFGDYFSKRLANGSLGSTHDAKYVLLVLRNNYKVICVEVANPYNNWLAGSIVID